MQFRVKGLGLRISQVKTGVPVAKLEILWIVRRVCLAEGPNHGYIFGGPHNEDYRILGSILGPHRFMETTMSASLHLKKRFTEIGIGKRFRLGGQHQQRFRVFRVWGSRGKQEQEGFLRNGG